MKIAIVSDWFAEKMGYAENVLPKALAKLGPQVHVLTSDLQPDFPNYEQAYEPFLGPRIQPVGVKDLQGYRLHRLPSGSQRHGVRIKGLLGELRRLRPDVVQCFTLPSWSTYQSALGRVRFGYKLFLEEHIHMSVFQWRRTLKNHLLLWGYRQLVGKPLGVVSELCYPIAPDVQEVAVRYLGYPASKCRICSLGVDTDLFTPVATAEQAERRARLRRQLDVTEQELLCIYTGRFNPGKDPLCLARAVDQLQAQGLPVRGLFVGSGTAAEVADISACRGCVIHPFVEYPFLPDFYRAADLGVWPRQESTSQLDAAACGLPLILSDRISVRERVDGNGLLYAEGDAADLARCIRQLLDPQVRAPLSAHGAQKVRERFSWDRIARERLHDYEQALR